jgi:hypothetical protein
VQPRLDRTLTDSQDLGDLRHTQVGLVMQHDDLTLGTGQSPHGVPQLGSLGRQLNLLDIDVQKPLG